MGQFTDIQWCHSTINPTTGCDGCELWAGDDRTCYAGNYHEDRMANALPQLYAKDFKEVRLAPNRMRNAAGWSDLLKVTGSVEAKRQHAAKPWLDGLPRLIFISDMSDALSDAVPFEYLQTEVIETVASVRGKRHMYLWLTKQPARAVEFELWLRERDIEWPKNLGMGTSLTTQATLPRAMTLARHSAPYKYLSIEPMRGPVDLSRLGELPRGTFAQAILGGGSGNEKVATEILWFYRLLRQCRELGIPPFVKQLGSRVHMSFSTWQSAFQQLTDKHDFTLDEAGASMGIWRGYDSHGGDWIEWPEDLRVRDADGELIRSLVTSTSAAKVA